MKAKTIKAEKQEKKLAKEKDYLLHFVLFILGISAGLLYYRIFLEACYQ